VGAELCTITSQLIISHTTEASRLLTLFTCACHNFRLLESWNLDPLTSLEGLCRPYKYEDGLHLSVHVCGDCSEDIGG
jgi:hypothetical protein